MTAAPALVACRPRQWVKNILVFAAPGAAGRLDEFDVVGRALAAFVVFCLASSATYLINDVRDRESDRFHPTKRLRPVASGALAPRRAEVLAAVLAAAAIALAVAVRPALAVVVIAYLALTVAYSIWLKHIPVVDLVAVASGFVLRAVAGGVATAIGLSVWFVAVTVTGSMVVVTGKRLGELRRRHNLAARPILQKYTREGLEGILAAASIAAVVAYLIWALEGEIADTAPALVSAVPFAGALGRYAMVVDQGRGEDPEEILAEDRPFQALAVVWVLVYLVAVYG